MFLCITYRNFASAQELQKGFQRAESRRLNIDTAFLQLDLGKSTPQFTRHFFF